MGAGESSSLASVSSSPSEVLLLDGTKLPCERLGDEGKPALTWGHGLGPKEPWTMNRRTCESFNMINEAYEVGEDVFPFSLVLYDARGHGNSVGWEHSAECIQQFHWRCLAIDMLRVAEKHHCTNDETQGVLLGGFSMGASSALWAAYLYPTSVRGLVLLCVTTAWEIRETRRGNLLSNADRLVASNPAASHVVRGAAYSDLPSLEDLRKANLQMPVFLACARDDSTHPAQVIERLSEVLPNSKTLIVDTTAALKQSFPREIRAWLESFNTVSK